MSKKTNPFEQFGYFRYEDFLRRNNLDDEGLMEICDLKQSTINRYYKTGKSAPDPVCIRLVELLKQDRFTEELRTSENQRRDVVEKVSSLKKRIDSLSWLLSEHSATLQSISDQIMEITGEEQRYIVEERKHYRQFEDHQTIPFRPTNPIGEVIESLSNSMTDAQQRLSKLPNSDGGTTAFKLSHLKSQLAIFNAQLAQMMEPNKAEEAQA